MHALSRFWVEWVPETGSHNHPKETSDGQEFQRGCWPALCPADHGLWWGLSSPSHDPQVNVLRVTSPASVASGWNTCYLGNWETISLPIKFLRTETNVCLPSTCVPLGVPPVFIPEDILIKVWNSHRETHLLTDALRIATTIITLRFPSANMYKAVVGRGWRYFSWRADGLKLRKGASDLQTRHRRHRRPRWTIWSYNELMLTLLIFQ